MIFAIIFMVIIIIAMIAFWFGLGQFTLGYLDNYVAGAPDWLNTGNAFGWIAFTLAFLLVVSVLKFLFGMLNAAIAAAVVGVFSLFGVAASAPFSKKGNLKRTLLTGAGISGGIGLVIVSVGILVWWVIFSVQATKSFFAFTAQYPDLTDFFVTSNWFVIMVFFAILGIVTPSSSSSN